MPYIPCPSCGVRTYSAATWSNTDHCPRCGCDLPPRTRTLVPLAGPSQQLRWATQIDSAKIAPRQLRNRSG